MARKKVKLAWITNDSARRATFKKRKKGLMKKVSELSTLCGVNACAIVYSPYDPEPEVWPSPSEAQNVINTFKNLPEMEQSKKMMNQEGFFRQRISKLKEQLRRQQRENREYEMTQVMYQALGGNRGLHDLCSQDLSDLGWLVDEKIKTVQERIEMLTTTTPQLQHQQVITTTPQQQHQHHHQVMSGQDDQRMKMIGSMENENMNLDTAMEALQRHPWFMEDGEINPHENVGYAADELVMSYGDTTNPWANAFFP